MDAEHTTYTDTTSTTTHGTALSHEKLVKPFIPTAEELAMYYAHHGRRTPAAAPTQGPGAATVAALLGPPPLPDLTACLVTAERLRSLRLVRRRSLLDRWLCAGDLGYIFAPRGVGKTWLAMSLPLAISLGRPLGKWQAGEQALPAEAEPQAPAGVQMLGGAVSKPVRVLYVDGEMPMELTQQRSGSLQLETGDITYLHHEVVFAEHHTSLNLAHASHREAVTRLIVEQGFECVILDNLSSLTSGLDENAGIDFDPLSQWLLELRRRQITVIIVHHAGRNGLMRGHSKREDACSWILELRDAKTEEDAGAKFTTHFAKASRNTGDAMPDLVWHFSATEEGGMEIGCDYANGQEFEAFLQHVKDGIQSQSDIAELMSKPKGTICKWAAKALREGQLSGNSRRLLPPKQADTTTPAPPRAYRDDDDDDEAPRETSFFDDIVLEAELAAANAEAQRLRNHD